MATSSTVDYAPTLLEPAVAELVARVVESTRVVVSIADLGAKLGISVERACVLAKVAERGGEVQLWADAPGGPGVTLTPLVAKRLGIRPTEDGLRWLAIGQRDSPRKVRQSYGASETGFIPGYHDRADPRSELRSAIPGRRKLAHSGASG